jgi:peptide-methionine (R)-S-oxide reductase
MDMDKEKLKKRLTPMEYKVTQEGGTEMPGTGEYVHTKEAGTYKCKVCSTPLFSSDTKFDSGTGWPSFDQALPGAVNFITDDTLGMSRTEVVCATCHAHLGHMFNDGPKETTGQRFCMNSCALDLEKK